MVRSVCIPTRSVGTRVNILILLGSVFMVRLRSPRTAELIRVSLDELHAKKDKILALSGQYGARRIRVFDSVSRGEERPDSDIDFLVDFPQGYDFFQQRLPLAEQLLTRPVEVIPEHELNRYIREKALKEAVNL